jgi:platelet-activating factor acetylhydrolase IB subunit alpha
MSLLLTDRQRSELNVAILEYMMQQPEKYRSSIDSFRREAGIEGDVDVSKGLLEKKWGIIVRLQKKVQDLEAMIAQMQQTRVSGGDLDNSPVAEGGVPEGRMIPKPPAKFILVGHRSPVITVAVHPIYSVCASGSEDNTIRIWDHETGSYERTLKGHTGYVTGLAFNARGTMLASCSLDMSAKLWECTNYTCTKTLRGHEHTISAIKFIPSGDHVVTCSRDNSVKLWEVGSGYCTKTFTGHSDWIKSIAISGDGLYLASAGSDQNIIIWNIESGAIIQVNRKKLSEQVFHILMIASLL